MEFFIAQALIAGVSFAIIMVVVGWIQKKLKLYREARGHKDDDIPV